MFRDNNFFSFGQLAGLAICGSLCVTLTGCGPTRPAPAAPSSAVNPFASAMINTVAGSGTQGFKGDGGQALAAQFSLPDGVAVDASGNIFVSDLQNVRVRKITPAGVISTYAGNGNVGTTGDGGPATSASLVGPMGLAVDAAGNLYIADSSTTVNSSKIRVVTPAGIISTVVSNSGTLCNASSAISATAPCGDGGLATAATLNIATGVAVDASGSLYIADLYDYRVRKVTSGMITTIAGNGNAGYNGDGGSAIAPSIAATSTTPAVLGARLNQPYSVAVDGSGNVYVADRINNVIRKIAGGNLTTVVGNGLIGSPAEGYGATTEAINNPYGIAVDSSGNLFIADFFSSKVRVLTTAGLLFTYAGSGVAGFAGDGSAASAAQIYGPTAVALDSTGAVYIVDQTNSRVRRAK